MNRQLQTHYRNRNAIFLLTWALGIIGWILTQWAIMFLGIIALNVYALVIMFLDKRASKMKKVRVPEKSLLMLVALGGAVGIGLGMLFVRHKTKHLSFQMTVPISLLIQIAIFNYIWNG